MRRGVRLDPERGGGTRGALINIGVVERARGRGVALAMAARSFLAMARRKMRFAGYTLVLDDNWASRRTALSLGAHVTGNFVTYRRRFVVFIASMLSLRFVVLFVHIVAVIVALGGSLFSTFALAPVLAAELDPPARLRVSRRIVRRLGAIVLTSLAVLVVTGILNVLFIGGVSILLAIKLVLVVVVIGLALYQYGNIGAQIWRAAGPGPEVAALQARFRRVGLDRRLDRDADSISFDRTDARRWRDCRVDSLKAHRWHERKNRAERPPGWGGSRSSRSCSALSSHSATERARISRCDTSIRRSAHGGTPTSFAIVECAAAAVGMLIGIRIGARLVDGALKNRSMIAAVIVGALVLPIVGRLSAEVARFRFTSGGSVTEFADRPFRLRRWNRSLTSF